MEAEITGAAWRNWKKCSEIFCNRRKDASETEGDGLQNSDQVTDAIWSRKVGYNEAPGMRLANTIQCNAI